MAPEERVSAAPRRRPGTRGDAWRENHFRHISEDTLVLFTMKILHHPIGNNTGKLIVSDSTYDRVQKEESNGMESGKTCSLSRVWSDCFEHAEPDVEDL